MKADRAVSCRTAAISLSDHQRIRADFSERLIADKVPSVCFKTSVKTASGFQVANSHHKERYRSLLRRTLLAEQQTNASAFTRQLFTNGYPWYFAHLPVEQNCWPAKRLQAGQLAKGSGQCNKPIVVHQQQP